MNNYITTKKTTNVHFKKVKKIKIKYTTNKNTIGQTPQVHSFSTYLDCKTGGVKVGVNGLRCNFTELSKSEVQLAVGGAPKKKNPGGKQHHDQTRHCGEAKPRRTKAQGSFKSP